VPAAPDRHTGEPHIHADHLYVAATASPRPVRQPEHEVRWFTPADIASDPGISEDSRILAAELLALAAPQPAPPFRWLPGQGPATAAGHQADTAAGRGSSRTGHDPAHHVGNLRYHNVRNESPTAGPTWAGVPDLGSQGVRFRQ
jgi:hypothetical protein